MEENGIDKIDFLKMDCEGSEYKILDNLPKDIFNRIITISLEFHDLKDHKYTGNRIVKILKNNNFDIVKFKYEKTYLGLNYGKVIGTK